MNLLNLGGDGLDATRRYSVETDRLLLRTPQLADAPAVANLVNDRRIAENTTRIIVSPTPRTGSRWRTPTCATALCSSPCATDR